MVSPLPNHSHFRCIQTSLPSVSGFCAGSQRKCFARRGTAIDWDLQGGHAPLKRASKTNSIDISGKRPALAGISSEWCGSGQAFLLRTGLNIKERDVQRNECKQTTHNEKVIGLVL